MEEAIKLLKKHFGYANFRGGQAEIISHILKGEDVLGIMPTGAGKSICYQIPALMLEGTTFVISPLISLMKDQVDSLNEVGISACYLNSTLSQKDTMQALENINLGMYKLVYIAPEKLEQDNFSKFLSNLKIPLIAIDEAHCVSGWGHDFRPSYRKIAEVIEKLPVRPTVASFTATATEYVKEDIANLLNLKNPFILVTGFDRKNLHFRVETPQSKRQFLIEYLKENQSKSGIIYCLTRKNVDELYENLNAQGFNVAKYHAGMPDKERIQNQNDFIYDRKEIMIATNAFGMGIDKSNVRFVVHYNMPQDLESYYQEAGRAGRDGQDAQCILLFSRADIMTNKYLISLGNEETSSIEYKKLNDMIDFCNTDKCLRKYMLEYFGEIPLFDNCENCSNCLSQIEQTDITEDSKKILSCIKRMHERFGINLVTDVLKGSNATKIKQMGFDKLSTYGIMKEYKKDTIKDLIAFLVTEGYIEQTEGEYPVIKLRPEAKKILFDGETVTIKRKIEKKQPKAEKQNISEEYNQELFEALRKHRMELSKQYKVPPFIIFADTSLKQMASKCPTTKEKMLEISGVGETKFANYGEGFIEVIENFLQNTDTKWYNK